MQVETLVHDKKKNELRFIVDDLSFVESPENKNTKNKGFSSFILFLIKTIKSQIIYSRIFLSR